MNEKQVRCGLFFNFFKIQIYYRRREGLQVGGLLRWDSSSQDDFRIAPFLFTLELESWKR